MLHWPPHTGVPSLYWRLSHLRFCEQLPSRTQCLGDLVLTAFHKGRHERDLSRRKRLVHSSESEAHLVGFWAVYGLRATRSPSCLSACSHQSSSPWGVSLVTVNSRAKLDMLRRPICSSLPIRCFLLLRPSVPRGSGRPGSGSTPSWACPRLLSKRGLHDLIQLLPGA